MTLNNAVLWRQLASALFLLDILFYLPAARVLFGGGYELDDSPRKRHLAGILLLWSACVIFLMLGILPLLSSFGLLLVFRHLYVNHRWDNLFRGGGAPGFMSHQQSLYLFLASLSAALADRLGWHVGLAYRMDLGLIILCSGIYKAVAGYTRGEGMEYGCANPIWSYWSGRFKRVSPGNIYFRAQNWLAVLTQIAAGTFILLSIAWAPFQYAGALLLASMFLFLIFVIRLGRLAALMALAALPLFPELGLSLFPGPDLWFPEARLNAWVPESWVHGLQTSLIAFSALLVVIKLTQYLNFYGNRELPGFLQRAITRLASWIPIIIWRVFTPDVTNFFVRIHAIDRSTGRSRTIADEDTAYSYKSWRSIREKLRFLMVTESITVTTVFTTQRYFPSDPSIFEKRLIRYAKSLSFRPGEDLKFQVVMIAKMDRCFEYIPVIEYLVTDECSKIVETRLRDDYDFRSKAKFSPIRESQGYGKYAPKLGTPS